MVDNGVVGLLCHIRGQLNSLRLHPRDLNIPYGHNLLIPHLRGWDYHRQKKAVDGLKLRVASLGGLSGSLILILLSVIDREKMTYTVKQEKTSKLSPWSAAMTTRDVGIILSVSPFLPFYIVCNCLTSNQKQAL